MMAQPTGLETFILRSGHLCAGHLDGLEKYILQMQLILSLDKTNTFVMQLKSIWLQLKYNYAERTVA